MKLDCNRTAILIGLGFSACLTLIILRGLFFSKGFLALGDATFSHNMSWNRDMFTHSWGQFMGWDNSNRALHLPFMLPLTHLFSNTGTFTKALYFIIFTLIGTTSFSVAFAWLRERGTKLSFSYVGASVCALVYALSTYTTIVIGHYGGLFSYALLPLTFWFTRAAFRQRSYSPVVVLKYGTVLGLILMLATTMYYVFTLHVVVLVVTALGQVLPRLIQERREVRRYLLYSLCLTGLTAAAFALLWAWYILPFLVSHRMGLTEIRHITIDSSYIRAAAQNGNLFNVVRMLGFNDTDSGILVCSGSFRTIWLHATLAVPVLAIIGAILRPRNRDTIVLVAIAAIGVFLAKGPNGPFGNQYLWLFSHFELPFLTGGLYYPIRAIPLVILPYAFLSAFAVTNILRMLQIRSYPRFSASAFTRVLESVSTRKQRWARILSVSRVAVVYALICALICISSFPLLTGNRRGTMNTMVVPQPYHNVNDWLSEDGGDYRVAWLPPSDTLEWNPHGNSPDPWYNMHVAYIPPLLSSQPITSADGMGRSSKPVERERLEQYIYYLLNGHKESSLGTLLAMENAKYLLYHDDTKDKEAFSDLFATLNQAGALTQVYSSDYVYVFENEDYQSYLHTEGKSTLVVGGLDSLGTAVIPDRRSFIFLEQSANTPDQIDTMLKCTDSILFYANKDIDDLVLGSLDSIYYHPALECWQGDYRSPWTRDFFYSLYWYHQRILPAGVASTWDFDLNLGVMRTDKANAELNFKVDTAQGSYEIWVRNLLGSTGNSLEASIDGETIGQIDSYSQDLQGFKWQRIGQRDFDKGQHEIVLKTAADGFNAVNTIAVVPTRTLEQHQNEILDRIQSSNIRLMYLTDHTKMSSPDRPACARISDNPSEWISSYGAPTISLDLTNVVEGESSLRVDGSGATELWYPIRDPSLVSCCTSYDNRLSLSLRFGDVPAGLRGISIYVTDGSTRMEWQINPNELVPGEWQDFSMPLNSPLSVVPDVVRSYGVPSGLPTLGIAVYSDVGCAYSYNVDDMKSVSNTKSAQFDTIGEQEYLVGVSVVPEGDNAALSLSVDGTRTDFSVGEPGWLYTTILPSAGIAKQEIAIGCRGVKVNSVAAFQPIGDAQSPFGTLDHKVNGNVTDYTLVSPTRITLRVNVSEPCILSFPEAYHPSWIATDDEGKRLPKIALNSVTNGFLLERTGTYKIVLEFELEDDLIIGEVISGLTLVSLLGTLAFIHYRGRRKARSMGPA
jgi:hypothetical protein